MYAVCLTHRSQHGHALIDLPAPTGPSTSNTFSPGFMKSFRSLLQWNMERKKIHPTQLQTFHSMLKYYTNLKSYKTYQNTLKKSNVLYRIN